MQACQIESNKITTLIRRQQHHYCLVCFTFCLNSHYSQGDSIRTGITSTDREELSCECTTHLPKEALLDKAKKFIQNAQHKPTNKSAQLQYIRDSALLEEIYKINLAETLLSTADDLISEDKKRFGSLKGSDFNWQTMKPKEIDARAELINFLRLSSNPLARLKHPYSNYAKSILNRGFSDVDSKNYNAVAAYHTSCMKLLAHTTFLNEVKYGLEKLDYQTLGSVNMIARARIRQRNVLRLARSEGANSRREWLENILRWADTYVLDENRVWIRHYNGEVHQAYMYPIRFIRDMVVYGLITTEQELTDVMTSLYNKVSKFKGTETSFINALNEPTKEDQKYIDSSPKYVDTVLTDLRDVRGYYIEIVYHLFFLQIDFQMLKLIQTGKDKLEGLRVFDQDFSRKTLEMYMGYVLRPLGWRNYHLIYGKGDGELCKISYLVRKFIQMINNTDDEYIQSLWLTKSKDLEHYNLISSSNANYEQTDKMPRLKELSDSMRRVIEDYFVLNKGLYEEQKVVQQLAIIVEGVVQAFSINERLQSMKLERLSGRNLTNPETRQAIYKQQLQLLQSNMLFNLQSILVLFLKAGTQPDTLRLKDRIFDIFKFGYYRNSLCISSFVQKTSLNKLEDVFPEDLFGLLDFSFYNNWIAFTSKGLLNFTKNIWSQTMQKLLRSLSTSNKREQDQIFSTVNKILGFVQKWNLSDEESVLKYLSSSSLEIVDELLYLTDPEKGRIDLLNILTHHKVFDQFFNGKLRSEAQFTPQQEFAVLYLETVMSFVEKRYEWEVFERLRKFFPLLAIDNHLKIVTGRPRSVLLSALEFLYIDVKNNLLEGRDKLTPKQPPLRPTIYAEPYLMEEDYNRIIDILSNELDRLLQSLDEGKLDRDYVMNGILSPVLRLTAYFSMVPEEQGVLLKEYKDPLDRLRNKLLRVSELQIELSQFYGFGKKDTNDMGSTTAIIGNSLEQRPNTPDNNIHIKGEQHSGQKLRHEELELVDLHGGTGTIHPDRRYNSNNWLKQLLSKTNEQLERKEESDRQKAQVATICYVLWQYTNRLAGSQRVSGKYNCFLENEDDPKRVLLQSKAKRQYLYSNKMDIRKRQKDSSLIKFKAKISTQENRKNDFLTRIQGAYSGYKATLTSTEAIDNFYLKKMLSTKEEDQDLIFNLCSYMVNELSKPISFKDRNPFYNIMECLCNMLFVATSNTQKVLYRISRGKARQDPVEEQTQEQARQPIRWIQNLWTYMLQSSLFIRYKIHQDSVWMDEYMRLWLIVKLLHFLVEVNNKEWKNHFVVVPFEGEKSAGMLDRRDSLLSVFDSAGNSNDRPRGMMMGLISLIERMCRQQNWHTRNSEEGALQKFNYNVREQLFDPAVLIIDLLNEIFSGPCIEAQRAGYTYLVDQINGILNRYIKDYTSQFYTLKQKCIELLKNVTEGGDAIIRRFILDNYPISMLNNVLVNSMKQLHCEFTSKQKGSRHPALTIQDYDYVAGDQQALFLNYITQPDNFGDKALLNISYELYNYFSSMAKQSVKYKNFYKDKIKKAVQDDTSTDKQIVSYHFLGRIAMRIQVRTDEGDEELCFKAPGKFVFLSTETRNEFESEVDRSSGAAKINALVNEYKYFKLEMDHYEKHFRKRYWVFKYVVENLYVAEILVYIICLALNFTLIYDLGNQNSQQITHLSLIEVYFGLGYTVVAISLIAWLIWVISRLGFSFQMGVDQLDDTLPDDEQVTNLQKVLILAKILFGDPESLVFLYHILMCFLGMYVNVCFFALELLIIVNRVPTLNYIVKSVYLHWDQLLLTFLLECLIIYVYGFICYISYQGRFLVGASLQTDNTSSNEAYCQNIVHCWMNFMNEAITSGNGIGILMGTESYSSNNLGFFYSRFFVDVTFYLIVNVVMINIIQGIIVDTFSQLRENSETYEKDKLWVCFICNQKYEDFVSRGESFYKHIENEHNMWKYVYFLVYLDEKNEKDCDGLESKLKTMVRNEDSSWIPTVKEQDAVSEALQKEREEQKKLVGSKLKQMFVDFRHNLQEKLEAKLEAKPK